MATDKDGNNLCDRCWKKPVERISGEGWYCTQCAYLVGRSTGFSQGCVTGVVCILSVVMIIFFTIIAYKDFYHK